MLQFRKVGDGQFQILFSDYVPSINKMPNDTRVCVICDKKRDGKEEEVENPDTNLLIPILVYVVPCFYHYFGTKKDF